MSLTVVNNSSKHVEGSMKNKVSHPWLVLLVDDEAAMREMLSMWLQGLTFHDRPIQVLEASSGPEALIILRRTPDIAVVIMDQVMDDPTEGLDTALKIRQVLGFKEVRIILNTAMNERLPKLDVLQREDINDIQYKNDLSVLKFQSLIITNLRNYRDLMNLRIAEALSTRLLQINNRIQASETEDDLLQSAISAVHFICASISPMPPKPNPEVFILKGSDEVVVLRGSGMFERHCGESIQFLLDESKRELVLESIHEGRALWKNNFFIYPFKLSDGAQVALGGLASEDWDVYTINYLRLFVPRLPMVWERLILVNRLRQRQDELQQALKEREVLLREVHHRVKNNLQIISSLISMDKSIDRIQDRIYSMALVHDQLYHMQRFSEVDLVHYLESLCADLANAFQLGDRLMIESASKSIFIPYDRAIPLGLVINELVVNAAKYALKTRPDGKIHVKIISESPLILWVEDDGPGFKESTGGTGLKLVQMLLEQLKGELRSYYQDGQRMEVYLP